MSEGGDPGTGGVFLRTILGIRGSLTMAATDRLSRIFGALADPTRRAILARLADGPASVGDLAEPFVMSFAAVSKHIRVPGGRGAGLPRTRCAVSSDNTRCHAGIGLPDMLQPATN
jgi:DNA-binding transcriptional ArsR family regulator